MPSCPDTTGAGESSPPACLIDSPSPLFFTAGGCLSKVHVHLFQSRFNCINSGSTQKHRSRGNALSTEQTYFSDSFHYMESFPLNSLLLLPSFPPCSSWTVLWSRLWFCSPGSSCWSGTRLCISSASSSASWEWDAWRAQMCLWEGIREQVSLCVHRVTWLCGWDQGKTWNVHGSWWKQGTWASYCLCLNSCLFPYT